MRSCCSLRPFPKQWNAWQETAAPTVIPPAEARVIWRTLRKQGLQDRVMQSRFVLVQQIEGKSTAENPSDTKASARIVVPGYADPDVLDIRRDSPTACREGINVLLAISANKRREKWALLTADVQATFLKGEFQHKDRFLDCWPPKKRACFPRSSAWQFVAHPERSLWIERCTSQVVGEIFQNTRSDLGFGINECVLNYSRCTHQQVC